MDALKTRLEDFWEKKKYVLLVILAGIILMTIPLQQSEPDTETVSNEEISSDICQQLEQILMLVDGAGKVSVLLTEYRGEQILYEYDEDSSENESSTTVRRDTVIITDEERAQQGLIRQIIPPEYLGAIIVCQGGDDPVVRLRIVEAVADVTGLTTDRITVLKMK